MLRDALIALLLISLAPVPALAEDCGIPGDIAPAPDGDGVVDVADAVLALSWAVQMDHPSDDAAARRGDVAPYVWREQATICPTGCPDEAVGDGVVDVADVAAICRVAVGMMDLAWPLSVSGRVYDHAPEHSAIRWRIGASLTTLDDCPDRQPVAHHSPVRQFLEGEPCASTLVEEVRHWSHGELYGYDITCELDILSADEAPTEGSAWAWWRSPEPLLEHVPTRVEVRTLAGAWVRVD